MPGIGEIHAPTGPLEEWDAEFLFVPPDQVIGEWPRKLTAQEVKESLLAFTEHLDLLDDPASLFEALRSRFDLYESVSDQGHENNLFTGYYQPIIEASLIETPTHRFPIYRRPDDLIEIDPTPFAPRLQGEKVVGRVDGNRLVPYFNSMLLYEACRKL